MDEKTYMTAILISC